MQEKYDEVLEKLKKYDQEHLLLFYNELTDLEKENLLNQLLEIDYEGMKELYNDTLDLLSKISSKSENVNIEPIKAVDEMRLLDEVRDQYVKRGEEIVRLGKYAIATMAGGQR